MNSQRLRSTGLPIWARSSATLKREAARDVVEVARARDVDGGVVLPAIGVADLDTEGAELFEGALLGGRGPPVKAFESVVHGGKNIRNHLGGTLLGLRREVSLDVLLTERLTEEFVGLDGAACGTGFELGDPGKLVAVEVEAGVDEGRRETGGEGAEEVPA